LWVKIDYIMLCYKMNPDVVYVTIRINERFVFCTSDAYKLLAYVLSLNRWVKYKVNFVINYQTRADIKVILVVDTHIGIRAFDDIHSVYHEIRKLSNAWSAWFVIVDKDCDHICYEQFKFRRFISEIHMELSMIKFTLHTGEKLYF
jgi:hypothetical protein